jgi:hypothetical protein
MPSSSNHQLSLITDWISKLQPQKVLDIGIGNGRYGFLCRDILDTPFETPPHRIVLEGIEGYEKYVTDIHKIIYDKIYFGNCLQLIDQIKDDYDLILLIDVIEHLDKEDGMIFLKKLTTISRNVIVGTPKGFTSQDDVFGNELERHRSGWLPSDFKKIEGAVVREIKLEFPYKLVCFFGKDYLKIKLKSRGKKLAGLIRYNRFFRVMTTIGKKIGITKIKAIRKFFGLDQ